MTFAPVNGAFIRKSRTYTPNAAQTMMWTVLLQRVFATVQNKLHYAITKHTAAEIIYDRADSTKPNMGLTTWKMHPAAESANLML